MPSGTGNDRSSPFDRMLAESRSQFDALLRKPKRDSVVTRSDRPRGTPPPTSSSAAADRPTPPAKHVVPPSPALAQPSSSPATAAEPFHIRATDLGRTLIGRFGDAWRYDIVDTRRDGEDVVVWGRLVVEDRGYDKTRRGRARIQGPGGDVPVTASAGGADFVLRAGSPSPNSEQGEQAAYEEAATIALAACARGI